MATFFEDSFFDTATTAIESHVPTTISSNTAQSLAWTKHAASSTISGQISNANRARTSTAGQTAVYYTSLTPSQNDYDLTMDVATLTSVADNVQALIWRVDPTSSNFYQIFFNQGTFYYNKIVGGTVSGSTSTLSTISVTGTDIVTIKVVVRSNTFTLSYSKNGGAFTTLSTPTDASSPLTSGRVGIRMSGAMTDTTGFHADNFTATYPSSSTQTIYADDSAWRKSPYNHKVTGTGATSVDITVNTGAYWRLYVSGMTATANLTFNTANNTGTLPKIAYRWNGGPWTRADVGSSVALTNFPTAATVKHLLEFCIDATHTTTDRWTGTPPVNAVQFTGLVLDTAATISQVAARPKNVVVLGDSIKEGIYTLGNSGVAVNDTDNTLSAYFQLQEALNAEICLKAFSGLGVTTSLATGCNVPALISSYNLLYASNSITYSPQPDLLILDIGVNDGSGVSQTTMASNLVTIAQGVAAKATLIMGDEAGYSTTAYNNAVTTLVAAAGKAAYAAAATLALNLGSGTPTADTFEGGHPNAQAHRTKLLPAVAAAALPLLYATSSSGGIKRLGSFNGGI